nr:craniofacial development protein 2-like [Parasteatoda tepidariorum]
MNVRTYGGANVDSDHFLIIAKVRSKLSNAKKFKGETLRDNDCDKLKNERMRLEYCEKVKGQLNLMNYDGTVKNKWKCIKHSICNDANTAIGKVTKKQVEDWYDVDCAIANDKKNVAYKHMIQAHTRNSAEEYHRSRKGVKKLFSCPKYDVKIILGDLNTKVGREREFKFVTGGSILHDATNDSGHKLIDFATLHNMIIGRTSFPHKNIHKDTWRAPCGTYANQIDHVVIDARHCSDSMDFKGETLRDNDCDKLKNERIRLEYCEKVKEQLNLKNYDGTVKNKWKCIKDSICNAANTAIGKVTKKQVKYWYDIDCAIANDKNNVAYRHMIQAHRRNRAEEYHRRRKEVKKLFRQNKRVFDEELLIDVGHLKSINECRAFYRKINSSPLDFKQTSSLCRNKFGEIISDNQDILKRWHEHF